MKKRELYECEICGTRYKDKHECEKCESSHKTQLKVTQIRYLPFKNDGIGMPITITIESSDGKKAKYKR